MKKKNTKKKRKGFKIFLIVFIIIIVIMAKKGDKNVITSNIKSIFNKDEIISKVEDFLKIEKTFETIKTIPIDTEGEIQLYDNIIVKKDDEKIVAFNLEGMKVWQKIIEDDNDIVFLGNNYIYLCNKETGNIQMIKDNGEVNHIIETNPQLFHIVEKDDNLLLLFKGEEKESIVIMDKDRNILGNTSIKGEHIFTTTINSSKTKYAISTFKIEDGSISNYLYIYSINGKEIENMNFDESLILYIDYISDNNILVITDNEIFYLKDGEVLWTKEFRDGEDVYMDKDKGELYLLYEKSIEVVSNRGEVIKEIDLKESYKEILPFNEDKLILYGDEYVMILDRDKKVLKYKNEEKIKELKVKDSNIILLDSDKINIMTIKNKTLKFGE